ncbi:hypothetical protein ACS0PU_012725 [Formica fusca]
MILDSETSSSDTKMKNSDHNIKNSKTKTLYLGIMCFATNCLSLIAFEVGSYGSFRSVSRPAVFNNLLRRNYNLRIKIMMVDMLAAFVSTIMLTIGDMYGIPYLYLPWLINTIEGIALYEGPALFGLAYNVLPNASIPAGLFIFITLLLYVEELYIWKDVFVSFKRCWTNYNKNNNLNTKSSRVMNKELSNENKENLNISSGKLKDHQKVVKAVKNNLSIKNHCSKSPFTEVTG